MSGRSGGAEREGPPAQDSDRIVVDAPTLYKMLVIPGDQTWESRASLALLSASVNKTRP